jgi:hypothetical protein
MVISFFFKHSGKYECNGVYHLHFSVVIAFLQNFKWIGTGIIPSKSLNPYMLASENRSELGSKLSVTV